MAGINLKLLDTIDLTGDDPVITTEVIRDVISVVDSDDDDDDDDSENVVPVKKVKGVNKKCEICLDELSKYTCPGCAMKTCSLDCVLKHKQITGCSGQRNKTTFIARTEFNNIHLLNDYRLLEEAGRIADNARRDYKSKRIPRKKRELILRRYAHEAGVALYRMEKGMKRWKENKSSYQFCEKSINWAVKLVFDDIGKEFLEQHFDKEVMEEILAVYINKDKISPENKISFASYIQLEDGEEISVLFRNEFNPGTDKRYTIVDPKKTLKEILNNKSVLEYPEFHIVLPKTSVLLKAEEFIKGKTNVNIEPTVVPLQEWLAT